ncbi:MAG: hypothetical protein DI630_18110 [Gordonia sp. (in: high G+C Gram-positive bacteria)]|nr:MAG: hypothetical protein DI630_18110 [Gordonia sp. (in: high G+C Gram-positive bacteria)]
MLTLPPGLGVIPRNGDVSLDRGGLDVLHQGVFEGFAAGGSHGGRQRLVPLILRLAGVPEGSHGGARLLGHSIFIGSTGGLSGGLGGTVLVGVLLLACRSGGRGLLARTGAGRL